MDPITISLIALGISILSLSISVYQSGVDRRLQYEQSLGNLHARLTSRSLEILVSVEELMTTVEELPKEQQRVRMETIKKLIQIMEGLVEMRRSVKDLKVPPIFSTSMLLTRFAPIKSDIDDADIIFDELLVALKNKNISKINSTADGLIKRIYGSVDSIENNDA